MAIPRTTQATPVELLQRLHVAADYACAWTDFVHYYRPMIGRWALRWGLQPADADDLSQLIFVQLWRKMRVFRYDPAKSFRAWLKTLTYHAWCDWAAKNRRPEHSDAGQLLAQHEAQQSLAESLEEAFDHELLQQAFLRVQLRVAPRTWEAFRLTTFEGWSGAAVADHLQMKPATVFVARSKVQRLLREEVARRQPANVDEPAT